MSNLTEDDIRAACVAAGLPGAEVEPPDNVLAAYGIIARVVAAGYTAIVRDDGMAGCGHEADFMPLTEALASLQAWVARRREHHVARLAEIDRALGRAP